MEKVGTTLDQFTSSLTTLSSTLKDLSADQRSQGTEHLDVLGQIHYEVQGTKGFAGTCTFQHALNSERGLGSWLVSR